MDCLAIALALRGEFIFFLKGGVWQGAEAVCAPSAGLAQLADLPRVGDLLALQSSGSFQFVVMGRAETLSVGSWELPWAQAGQKALCSVPWRDAWSSWGQPLVGHCPCGGSLRVW